MMLGRAVDSVIQLSIIVRGIIDGKKRLDLGVGSSSGTIVSPDELILTDRRLIAPGSTDEKLRRIWKRGLRGERKTRSAS